MQYSPQTAERVRRALQEVFHFSTFASIGTFKIIFGR
jgi:hypothetical protein